MPPHLVVTYLRQVASALDKTHAAGIVHRDLKPENLFLTHREDGTPRIKILDFGISKVVSEAKTGSNATRSLGTPLYMAPEQVLGQPVGPATDLYSLALIAYTMLVGVAYWQSDTDKFDNAIAFALHTTRGTTDSAEKRAAELGRPLPPGFDSWFQRATHADPGQRFRRASEAINALAAVLGGSEISGAFAPVPSSTGQGALGSYRDAPTMIAAGTAPGTELDRSGTLPGTKRKVRALPWVLLAVLVGGALLTGAVVLRSHGDAAGASSSAASALPQAVEVSAPVAAPASVAPVVVAPVTASAEARSAGAAPVAPAAHTKPAGAGAQVALKGKLQPSPPKVSAPAAPSPLAPAPKYTRD
jgi:eukaryotic-like serine/threonine-protein kinase